mmetsp:Transcript_21912/g.46571  ORF Transcript_21912/g.46571 Transcript_21912/m.46571 type:complete len:261 (-) Transcript_21912:281-1063(-)
MAPAVCIDSGSKMAPEPVRIVPPTEPPTSRMRPSRARPPRLHAREPEVSTDQCKKPTCGVEIFDMGTPTGALVVDQCKVLPPSRTRPPRARPPPLHMPEFNADQCKKLNRRVEIFDVGTPSGALGADEGMKFSRGMDRFDLGTPDGSSRVEVFNLGTPRCNGRRSSSSKVSDSMALSATEKRPSSALSACSTRASSRSNSPSPMAQTPARKYSKEALQEMVAINEDLLFDVLNVGVPQLDDEDDSEDELSSMNLNSTEWY